MIVEIKRRRVGGDPYTQRFLYQGDVHRSVAYLLDSLNYNDDLFDVNGEKCRRISWECSCRQKQCGACAMLINGTPSLACSTFIDSLRLKNDKLTLAPLSKFPVIEDLRVDRSAIYESLKKMKLWLENDAAIIPQSAYAACYDGAKCLKCGLCLEACPNWCCDGELFAGAPAVPEAFIAICQGADVSRAVKRDFLRGCSKSGACAEVCPINMKMLSLTAMLARWRKKPVRPLLRSNGNGGA